MGKHTAGYPLNVAVIRAVGLADICLVRESRRLCGDGSFIVTFFQLKELFPDMSTLPLQQTALLTYTEI